MNKNFLQIMELIDVGSVDGIKIFLSVKDIDLLEEGKWEIKESKMIFKNITPLSYSLLKLYFLCCHERIDKVKNINNYVEIVKLILKYLNFKNKKIPVKYVDVFFKMNDECFNNMLLQIFDDKKYAYLWLLK